VLLENGIISKKDLPVKLLANWELKSKVNVIVNKASKTAIQAVEKASGKVELK
jgi:large subunit ribosomal protein L15